MSTPGTDQRVAHTLVLLTVVIFSAAGCSAALSQRYLYADGASYFLALRQTRAVSSFYPARYFAHLLTQYPTVVLLRDFASSNVDIAGLAYGVTIFLFPVLGLLVAWWIARESSADYVLFPLLSHAVLFLTGSFFATAESHVAPPLFWCLLLILVASQKITIFRGALLLAMAIAVTHTYESYLFLSWPLLYAAVSRVARAWAARSVLEAVVCAFCIPLFLCAVAVSLYSSLHPVDVGQRSEFIEGLILHLQYPPVWFSLGAIAVYVMCFCVPMPRPWPMILFLTVLVGGVSICVSAIIAPASIRPVFQYHARVQDLYVPLLLGAILLAKRRPEDPAILPRQRGMAWAVVLVTAMVSASYQLVATSRWNVYRAAVLNDLTHHEGLIRFEDSSVAAETGASGSLTQFNWDWTMPSLSVALSALNLHSVSAIIENRDADQWQPFDPRKPDEIPQLQDYAVPVRIQ